MAKTQMLNNLDSVGELVGYLTGTGEGVETDEYVEQLIKQAHDKTQEVFNVAAASMASAGHIQHVFEFGVAGVTRGPVRIGDPTSQDARLWVHTLQGNGGNQDIGYTFRPARQPNPKPTTQYTGVPSKYLRRLSNRRYIFWNKAFVMETGMEVEVKSRQPHGLLFVPTPGSNSPRNFVMWNTRRLGNINSTPGRGTQGSFQTFWMRWWSGTGAEIMENNMRSKVVSDIERAQLEAGRRARSEPIKPATANNPASVAQRARFAAMRDMKRRGLA